MQFYQFHIGDYTKNTAHLSDMEDLAYRRLMDLYYDTESPIDGDLSKVARRLRMVGYEDVIKIILEEFFYEKDSVWFHEVCEQNIKNYQKMRVAGKKTAAKRWKNKEKLNDSPPIAPLQGGNKAGYTGANANHKPETINHKPIEVFSTPTAKAVELPPPTIQFFDIDDLGKNPSKGLLRWSREYGVPEEWCKHLLEMGWELDEIVKESIKFSEYWVAGKGGDPRKSVKGWRQTWNNWMSNAEKWRK